MTFFEVLGICLATLGITVILQALDIIKDKKLMSLAIHFEFARKELFFPVLFVWVVLSTIALVTYKIFFTT